MKRIVRIIGILLGLAALALLAWVIVAGPVTVGRVIRYGDTDIDDYSHYPGRTLQPGDDPVHFAESQADLQLPASTLAQYGEAASLEELLQVNDTIAFLVLQDDAIVYERHFQGHSESAISQIFSVSKSVTSLLIGMAIDDGYLQGVDQPVTGYIPELTDEGFDAVTLHHLLTMTSGSSYQENDNPFGEHVILNYTPALEDEILRFTTERPPGEVWRYKSGDNALLGLALDRALGDESLTAYAQRRLWDPLGMQDRGVWSIDSEEGGLERTWCCLAASGRDLAKIGRLYLNEGLWEGDRLVSAEWLERSTTNQVPAELWPAEYAEAGWRGYGYQWWLASERGGDFFALGKDGQFIYANPVTDTVIVRLGWSSGELFGGQWVELFQAIADLAVET